MGVSFTFTEIASLRGVSERTRRDSRLKGAAWRLVSPHLEEVLELSGDHLARLVALYEAWGRPGKAAAYRSPQ